MVAVIVRQESKMDRDMIEALPLAISTIIVSPIARPNPSTQAANTPGNAAGNTTCHATCHGAAPRARAACENGRGTLVNASSEMVKITGITVRPRANPATQAFSRLS